MRTVWGVCLLWINKLHLQGFQIHVETDHLLLHLMNYGYKVQHHIFSYYPLNCMQDTFARARTRPQG